MGPACSTAAAGLAEVLCGKPEQAENGARIGIECDLGPTCPVGGLVQIPAPSATPPGRSTPFRRPDGRARARPATAHHVTPDPDQGPMIEQEVIRIDDTHDPRRLATVGRVAEVLALS